MSRIIRHTSPIVALAAALLVTGGPDRGVAGTSISVQPKAREIVERAVAVHGGLDVWLGKKDAAFTTTWTRYDEGRPVSSSRYLVKFPVDPGPVRTVVESQENGKPVLMGVSGNRSWFIVGDRRYDDLDSLKANRAFVRKVYDLLALPFRLDDPSCEILYDGQEVRAGAVVDRVKVQHGLDSPRLYLFDRQTGRLAGIGSPVSDPPTNTIGEYHEFDTVDGILIPTLQVFERIDARTGGRSRAFTVSIDRVTFDNGFAPATFEPPPVP